MTYNLYNINETEDFTNNLQKHYNTLNIPMEYILQEKLEINDLKKYYKQKLLICHPDKGINGSQEELDKTMIAYTEILNSLKLNDKEQQTLEEMNSEFEKLEEQRETNFLIYNKVNLSDKKKQKIESGSAVKFSKKDNKVFNKMFNENHDNDENGTNYGYKDEMTKSSFTGLLFSKDTDKMNTKLKKVLTNEGKKTDIKKDNDLIGITDINELNKLFNEKFENNVSNKVNNERQITLYDTNSHADYIASFNQTALINPRAINKPKEYNDLDEILKQREQEDTDALSKIPKPKKK